MRKKFFLSESELQTELLQQLNGVKNTGDDSWVLAGSIDPRGSVEHWSEPEKHLSVEDDSDKTIWRIDGSCSSFDGNHLAIKTDFYVKGRGFKSGPIRIFQYDGQQWLPNYDIRQEGFYETFLHNGALVVQHYDSIRIFKHGRNGWVLEQKLFDKDWLAGKDMPNKLQTLSFDGNTLLVTSRKYDFIYIFGKSEAGWSLEQEIEKKHFPSLNLIGKISRFTQLAALSNDSLAIADTEGGIVYVLRKSEDGWNLEQEITEKDFPLLRMPAKNKDGGYPQLSLSLNGDTLAIGTSGFEAVYIFRKSERSWGLEQEITKADLGKSVPRGAGLGGSVAIKGNILVAIASRPDEAAFIFERTNDGLWILKREVSNVTFPGVWQGKPQFGKPPVIADNGTVMIKSVQSILLFRRKS